MTEAGRAIQTMQVTEAIRDATVSGRKVKKGQTIVLDPDDGLLAVDNDPQKAVLAGLGRLEPGFGLLTIYYGETATLDEAETLARKVRETAPGRGRRGGPRRPAALPVPRLRRVSAERRRSAPASGSRSLKPKVVAGGAGDPRRAPRVPGRPVRDPAGRGPAAGRAPAGRRHRARPPVPPAPPLRRPARAADARRRPRPRRRQRRVDAGQRHRHLGPADLAPPRPGHDRAAHRRDGLRHGDVVRPPLHREARRARATCCWCRARSSTATAT